MKDQLVECKRCGGNACYEQHVDQSTTTWLCMGCGFTTTSEMKKDSAVVENIIATSPELYKDLLYEDESKFIWAPSTITIPGKGMVFIDGTSKSDWEWTAVLSIPLTEEEKLSGKYPEGQEFKMDMNSSRKFGQKEFMDALEVIGFYEN
jgi:hypothetical protein